MLSTDIRPGAVLLDAHAQVTHRVEEAFVTHHETQAWTATASGQFMETYTVALTVWDERTGWRDTARIEGAVETGWQLPAPVETSGSAPA